MKDLVFKPSDIVNVVCAAVDTDVKTATKYSDKNTTVKASMRCHSKRQLEIVLTIGRPNYAERQFIKQAIKAGEKFPIKKIQLKFIPKKK